MDVAQAITASAVPALVFSLLVWIIDKYEREPIPLMVLAFLWGAVPAIIVSIIAEIILGIPLYFLVGEEATELVTLGLGAPVIEEIAKGFALLLLALFFSKEFDGVMDGLVYGALIGFGFAMTENILYLVGCGIALSVDCQTLAFLRTQVFGLNHALYTAITGVALGFALTRRDASRWLIPPLGLWLAMLVHMLHNLAVTIASAVGPVGLIFAIIPDWGSILLLGLVVYLAWRRERAWMETHLREEISQGLITPQEFDVLMSWRRRVGAQLSALFRGGLGRVLAVRRRQSATTELAFLKERQARGEKVEEAKMAKLRERIRSLA